MDKICHTTKYTLVKSLRVKPQRIVKGTGYFMWDIMLPTHKECIKVSCQDLIKKELILRTEYEGWRKTM